MQLGYYYFQMQGWLAMNKLSGNLKTFMALVQEVRNGERTAGGKHERIHIQKGKQSYHKTLFLISNVLKRLYLKLSMEKEIL